MNIEKCPICEEYPNTHITECGRMGKVTVFHGIIECKKCKIMMDEKDVNENALRNRLVANWNIFCIAGQRGDQ